MNRLSMKYRNSFLFLLVLLTILCFPSCDNNDDPDDAEVGNWVKTTPFKGSRRSGAIVFTIGNKAYVGLGYDGDEYFTDFYEYDLDLGFWQTKTSFPGIPRERAVAFSINGKGYIGLGYNRDQTKEELGDVWEYDPATNNWKQLNNFGGTARYNAVGFSIGTKGYVGTGNDGSNYNGDFWEYEPVTDTWQEIVSYPGQKREEAIAFVLEGKAYLCTGRNNGTHDNDFWEFDPESKTWTSRKPDDEEDYYDEFTTAVRRHSAVAFVMDGKGYIATGTGSAGTVDNTVWEYNPQTQVWDEKTSFEGTARAYAVAFVLGGRTFLGTGQSGSSRFDDIWEFNPLDEYEEND
jgi:N-acetylneuraminic acid mutarotase